MVAVTREHVITGGQGFKYVLVKSTYTQVVHGQIKERVTYEIFYLLDALNNDEYKKEFLDKTKLKFYYDLKTSDPVKASQKFRKISNPDKKDHWEFIIFLLVLLGVFFLIDYFNK